MKKCIKVPVVLVLVLLMLMSWPVAAVSESGLANRNGPVKAENIELVKKVTLKGGSAKPAKGTVQASTGIVGAQLDATGVRYAIVIGINDYPGSGSDLQYAVADAESMKQTLVSDYGFLAENVTLLTDASANRTAIFNAVNALKSTMSSNDELVFYFSGHGAKGRAADGDRSNVDQSIVVCKPDYSGFDYIWDGELQTLFSGFRTNHIVFIFDSCLSGGMSVLGGTGRVVNMACTATGLSYEGDWGGGHGQFTYYFAIKGMDLKAADNALKPDNVVTVEEAFDYTKACCQSQTPTISDNFTNDLLP